MGQGELQDLLMSRVVALTQTLVVQIGVTGRRTVVPSFFVRPLQVERWHFPQIVKLWCFVAASSSDGRASVSATWFWRFHCPCVPLSSWLFGETPEMWRTRVSSVSVPRSRT